MDKDNRKITAVTGTVIQIPGDSIDTDRIIPARYMKGITFDGLGEYAFFDERFDEQGSPKDHPFNDEKNKKSCILLVGSNFGCGSSREHAPQALMRFGIKALIGISFADIFAGNCVQLGIPAVRISKEDHHTLSSMLSDDSAITCTIDVLNKNITAASIDFKLAIDHASYNALVSGMWDTTSLLLEQRETIIEKANELAYLNW